MTITMGQLISTMLDAYGRSLGDEELAAVATEIHVSELLARSPRRRQSRAPRSRARAHR